MSDINYEFLRYLIEERKHDLNDCYDFILAEHHYDNNNELIKKDKVDCCICLKSHRGIQMLNCQHLVCSLCHYKFEKGFISDSFYNNYQRPWLEVEKPSFPYKDSQEELLIIYRKLTDTDAYKDWFIYSNEDLYQSIKNNEEFIEELNESRLICKTNLQALNAMKSWFISDIKIQQYDSELSKYNNEYKRFQENYDLYERLWDAERKKICIKSCPRCSQ
jgi:hypothetical protein